MNKIFRFFIITFILILATFAASAQDSAAVVPVEQNSPSEAKPADAQADDKTAVAPSVDNANNGIMNIIPSEKDKNLFSISLRDAPLADLFRLMAQKYDLNVMIDPKVTGKVTITLNNITMDDALNTIAEMNNLKVEKKGVLVIIRPNLVMKQFNLRYLRLSSIIEVQTSTTVSQSAQAASQAAPASEASAPAATATTGTSISTTSTQQRVTFQKLLSPDGYVIPDTQGNSFMLVDYPDNVARVEEFIKAADRTREKKVIKLQYINAGDLMGVK